MSTLAEQDERADLQAQIRRLERDLEGERAKSARERRTNADLALLTHELRCHVAGLEEEVAKLRADSAREADEKTANLKILLVGANQKTSEQMRRWLSLRHEIGELCDQYMSSHPHKPGLLHVLDRMYELESTNASDAEQPSGDVEEGEPERGAYVAKPLLIPDSDTPASAIKAAAEAARPVTKEMAIAHMQVGGWLEFNGGAEQRRIHNGDPQCRSQFEAAAERLWSEWFEHPLDHMSLDPGFYTLIPIEAP